MAKKDSNGMEVLIAVYTTQAADSLSAELAAQRVHYLRRKIGSGEHGNFLMSMRNFGEEILVDRQDLETAKAIREEWIKNVDRFSNTWDGPKEVASVPGKFDKRTLYARIGAAVVLVIMVVWYIATRS
ncbi:hypothetical protein [Eubacterium oxidoreducens]|uniref:Uncharacterized protein n=1 Tax=Eubacterium oxidoreducens TaxID=1732 RepID=A0A1G6C184_EUBOX|nr:hypothetical protein [Eubacterium oxidoreducens]SDB26631.1 hypothetical protein SAMN02910417_01968 [Eubacterium oxidoreducens]